MRNAEIPESPAVPRACACACEGPDSWLGLLVVSVTLTGGLLLGVAVGSFIARWPA